MNEQKICYIDLYRNGVKCGNMGHVRMEWNQEHYRFGANLCHMDRQTLVTAVLERTGGRPRTTIQNIAIIHGKGSAQSDWMPLYGNEEQLLFQASGEVYGICRLPRMRGLSDEEEPGLYEVSADKTVREEIGQEEAKKSETKQEDINQKEIGQSGIERAESGQSETKREETEKEESGQIGTRRGGSEREETGQKETERKDRRQREQHVTVLSDDKWKQLCSIYPMVHPIGENVDFVKITPADFVILRQEYQNLVRNSFLLHGYYNYDHVLLGKYPDKYYIGVPGIMHEQERIAAAMFGFVGFERAKAPEEYKGSSDQFGYYMMEVGI